MSNNILKEDIKRVLDIMGVNKETYVPKPIIDVIILSYCKDSSIKEMNINCINSINNSTKNYKFNIILVETDTQNTHRYPQPNVTVIQPFEKFNYNRFLNIGLNFCKNNWVLITNNDTIYHKNFMDNMMIAHDNDPQLLSMSPMDNDSGYQTDLGFDKDVHYGYEIMKQLVGWSILLNKKVLDIIGKFDEDFTFLYQDADYGKKLEKNSIKHGCVTNSKAKHLVNVSHGMVEPKDYEEMTTGMEKMFNKKWG
jgi:GT2 family glycosyltransferase